MATDEELPEELDKLQITPVLPQVKQLDNNLPLALNPFFEEELKPTSDATHGRVGVERESRTTNCRRCRFRRASESSVLEEMKLTGGSSSCSDESLNTSNISGGVQKPSFKKCISSSAGTPGKKLILREPVLKAISACLHPQSSVRRKLLLPASSHSIDISTQTNERLPMAASKGMTDFRDLIEECRSLLTEDVDFSVRLNQLSLSSRNSKNFTKMQTQFCNKPRIRTTHKQLASTGTTTEVGSGGCVKDSNDEYHQQSSLAQPPSNLQRCSSSHTSCSQQAAGNTATTTSSDDVTIDELACYFDTFVHIPKKMSTMAEMMYI
ncbi:uncharacterized protein [Musca autumnalis]|uniref:uncharacterized protein n=1 Tax=Musca autumnalis TaxID=221902 RepID=UPI003CFAB66C